MNRILLDQRQVEYRLPASDPRFDHARGVLRLREADCFDVGLVNGPVGKGIVTAVNRRELHFSVEWGIVPPPPPDVRVLIGLSRPATVKRLMFAAPTLGVRELRFAVTEKVDPAYARSSLWIAEDWRKVVREGVEQAFDTWMPEVTLTSTLEEALAKLSGDATRVALDLYEAEGSLAEAIGPPAAPVWLALGPERGWGRRDREQLRAAGFALVHLPTRVLRLETAFAAALALVHHRRGESWTPPPRP